MDAEALARKQLRLAALRLLGQREWSVEQLQRRLLPLAQGLKLDEVTLGVVLDELQRAGWQSDGRFAQSLARRRAHFGSRRLEHELRASGVDPIAGSQALAEARASEGERCRAAWQKKFGTLPQDRAEHARQYRFLAARGFTGSAIESVLRGSNDE